MKSIISPILTIAVTVGFITALNLGLLYGQELWHKEDQQKLDSLKSELKLKEATLLSLKESIEAETYSNEDEVNEYNKMIEEHNQKVKQANELAEKIGARYHIVPRGRGLR